jgi:hypothetical protein
LGRVCNDMLQIPNKVQSERLLGVHHGVILKLWIVSPVDPER